MGQGTDPTLNPDQAAPDTTPTLDPEAGTSDPDVQPPGEGDPPANQQHNFEKRFSDLRTHSQGQDATIKALEQQNQMLTWQQQQQAAQQPQPAPAAPAQVPETTTGESALLNDNERSQLNTARENFDNSEINRLSELQARRAADQATKASNQQLFTGLTEQATVSGVIKEVNDAPEFKDEAVSRQILMETIAIQRDPAQARKYAAGQWNVNGVVINPFIMLDKLKDYRISKGAALGEAGKRAADSAHLDLGAEPGPDTAHPDTTGTFNAGIHLTETQRSAVRKAMMSKGTPFSGMSDTTAAYQKYWGKMKKPDQDRILKRGSREQSETGKTGNTIWRSGKGK